MLKLLYLAFIVCVVTGVYSDGSEFYSDNPCDGGELFSLVCKMLVAMKKDKEKGDREIDARFAKLIELQQNATNEVNEKIKQESERIYQKQAADVKMLESMIEKKIAEASSLLRNKIEENRKDVNLKLTSFVNKSDLDKVEQEITKKIDNNLVIQKQDVENLEKEIEEDKKEIESEIKSESSNVEKALNKKIDDSKESCQTSITSIKNTLTQQIQQSKTQIEDLYKKFDQVSVAKWPAGSYCILQSGACPAGFKSIQGWLRAINQFAANGNYIKAAKFGSSNIKCHGRCGQYGNWIGELTLSTCCK